MSKQQQQFLRAITETVDSIHLQNNKILALRQYAIRNNNKHKKASSPGSTSSSGNQQQSHQKQQQQQISPPEVSTDSPIRAPDCTTPNFIGPSCTCPACLFFREEQRTAAKRKQLRDAGGAVTSDARRGPSATTLLLGDSDNLLPVEQEDVVRAFPLVVVDGGVRKEKRNLPPAGGYAGGGVRQQQKQRGAVNKDDVRFSSSLDSSSLGCQDTSSGPLRSGITFVGQSTAPPPSAAMPARPGVLSHRPRPVDPQQSSSSSSNVHPSQNSVEVERHSGADGCESDSSVSGSSGAGDGAGVGDHEDEQTSRLPSDWLDGGSGAEEAGSSSPSSAVSPPDSTGRPADRDDYRTFPPSPAPAPGRSPAQHYRAQLEAGRSRRPVRSSGGGSAASSSRGPAPQAQGRAARVSGVDTSVRSQQGERRAGAGVATRDAPSLNEQRDFATSLDFKYKSPLNSSSHNHNSNKKHWSLLQRISSSSLPSKQQSDDLPIAVRNDLKSNIDLSAVARMLNGPTRERFNHLRELFLQPRYNPISNAQLPHSPVTDEQCLRMSRICEPASDTPTAGGGLFYFVLELKVGDDGILFHRLRPIFWPRPHNEWLREAGYVADVPLEHPSSYVDAVRDEVGATADFASGFFQVEIPAKYRHFFRYVTRGGNIMQMTKMPMGLSLSPEFFQIIAEASAGTARVCAERHVLRGCSVRVWIDDIQLTGERGRVEKGCEVVNKRIASIGGTLKTPLVVSTDYTFIGQHYHHPGVITVGAKTLSKLPESVEPNSHIPLNELRSLVGRLIWCSAVLRVPLAVVYNVIKWVGRKVSQRNRGMYDDDSPVKVPPAVAAGIKAWLAAARSELKLPPRSQIVAFTQLIPDSSLAGWGCTFQDAAGRIFLAGGKWDDDFELSKELTSGDIGRLEGRALRNGYNAFRQLIKRAGACHMQVDNTSVVAAAHKGHGKADSINIEIAPLMDAIVQDDIAYCITYIRTGDNVIADKVSRGRVVTREEVFSWYEGRGVW